MKPAEQARTILETLLVNLGFDAQIEVEMAPTGPVLQVSLEHADALIGARAERLEDLQYLVNRLLQTKGKEMPKIRVDVAHVREMKEDEMLEAVKAAADKVRETNQGVQLPAMNSFHRRLVHNLFAKDPQIQTWSSDDKSRLKKITLLPRRR